MKKLFYLLLLLILLSSCEDLICNGNQSDLANKWTALPTETLRFIPSIERNIIEFRVSEIVRLGSPSDCYNNYETHSIFGQDTITNEYLRGINYEITATQNDVQIYYSFLSADLFRGGNQTPNIQKIGCLSVLGESRCTNERNEIGNFTINGIPHKNVVELIENRSSNRKDVKRILVNNKGILQIEFFDGEIWSRIF
ncbi:hypothetical protein WAF17_10225 [Bernardetia sp. ABR2-2B]|uniref:hypothetical protein n=1 Tax=Bernardetia sp. ABR2-2B TaxID=3127472 RepID=UPI0030D043B5